MCGSGTILIEAALIAKNIPVNIFRQQFGFQSWKDFDEVLWEKIVETSLNKEKKYTGKITGSDNADHSSATSYGVYLVPEKLNNSDVSEFNIG